MSKIDELLKNEKVEWKKLGDVCEIKRGESITKKHIIQGNVPVIAGGIYPAYFHNKYNRIGEIITVAGSGVNAGFISYWNKPIFVSDAFSITSKSNGNTKINVRYLYHYLKKIQFKLFNLQQGHSIPHVYPKDVGKLKIPIPLLETQEKIVEILDKFTDYVTELQAELQAELQDRTKQYEYYRDMLLSEDYLNKLARNPELIGLDNRIKITTLGEIGVFTRGNGLQKKDFVSKGKPVIHYGQIYTKYNFESNKTFSFVNDEVFSKLKKANCNDILIATTSENIEDVGKAVVWLGDEEIGFSGDMYSYSTTQNSKYIAYYLQTTEFQRQKDKKVTGTKLIRIHGNDMAKFSISLPPIKIQNKVVEVLDKFQSLLADTEGLLPQEIKQRQKQYEYFREKLLTFDENVVQDKTRYNS